MTALHLRDGLARNARFRAWVSCVVALLAVVVTLHHGAMSDADMLGHGGHHVPSVPGAPMGGMRHHASPGTSAGTTSAGEPTVATAKAVAGVMGSGHSMLAGMSMATCLAILAGALLLPAVVWLRRAVARRRAARWAVRPERDARPPGRLAPPSWGPPPRGGPGLPLLLCVVRR